MKKLLVIPLMLAALALAGCANTKSIFAGGSSITATVPTPVGKRELAAIWNTYGLVLSGARTYKRLCAAGTVPASCREVIVQLQGYDRKAYAALTTASNFVRDNPTISAVSALGAARQAVADFQTVAITNGVVK